MMNCATCNEDIIEGQDTRECDVCGKKMHAMCAVDRTSPFDEYLRTIYPSRLQPVTTTYCYFCYEIEAVMVRYAMLGESLATVRGADAIAAVKAINIQWRAKYAAILDAWPREPKQAAELQRTLDDAVAKGDV